MIACSAVGEEDDSDVLRHCLPPLLARRRATPPTPRQRFSATTRGNPAFLDRSHAWDIRARLLDRGYTMRRAAREIGVSRATMSRIVRGPTRSSRIEEALARLLDPDQVLSPSAVKRQNSSATAEQ